MDLPLKHLLLFSALGWVNGLNEVSQESKIFPYEYEMRDLDNGLRIVVVPTDFPNLVSLHTPMQVGSRNEVDPGKTGFAHFFEHMMFRGTDNYSAEEYAAFYENAGASQNAWTWNDMTNYYVTLSKDDLEEALILEADRFQNINYTEEVFKTEAGAVLGEYNKNSVNQYRKLIEVQRNATFTTHTYKHTTMGFLEDIKDMPNQFQYSRAFFDRFYRPGNAVVLVVGDVNATETLYLVEKYWGSWESGAPLEEIPGEPESTGPIYEHVDFHVETLPLITVAFRGPAFSETENDKATLDVVSSIAFSSSSPLYQELVIQKQKVDYLGTHFPDTTDPYLFTVFAEVKNIDDIWYVRDEIMKTFATLRVEKVAERRLDEIKANLKYSFVNAMDNSKTIADSLVDYLGRTRDPETINRVYKLYDSVTAEDVMSKANKYYTDQNLVVVSLSHTSHTMPKQTNLVGSVDAIVEDMRKMPVQPLEHVLKRTDSPVIDLRILFNVGAADDPAGKEGLAKLTANMVTSGGSLYTSYKDIQNSLFPMAAGFGNQVDKEMTVFSGTTHSYNLQEYYEIISEQLLSPGWNENDFDRIKSTMINGIKNDIRNDDIDLAKEVLYEVIYEDHPYGHLDNGYISSLENMTLEDVKTFYNEKYTQSNLVLGLAGKFSDDFLSNIKDDLSKLPEGEATERKRPRPEPVTGKRAVIVAKDTRSTTVSFGYPIEVTLSHPDFIPLFVANTYLGGNSNARLFQRIREVRGLNYGDYSSVKYSLSTTNVGRQQEIFRALLYPLDSAENAHFAARVGMFELSNLVTNGISEDDFERSRNFVSNILNILTSTQGKQLGYAIDSRYYGIGEITSHFRAALENVTKEEVNEVIKKYLQVDDMTFVFVTKDAEDLRDRLINETTSIIDYPSEKPADVVEEDKLIQDYKLGFLDGDVQIVDVSDVFMGPFDSSLADDELLPLTPKNLPVEGDRTSTSGAISMQFSALIMVSFSLLFSGIYLFY